MSKTAHAPKAFVKALQKDPVVCPTQGCPGPVKAIEASPIHERIKSFDLHCERCGWTEHVAGQEQLDPPWDSASLSEIIDEHLFHLQPVCPYDNVPVHFQSLPSPRRKARYRITCHFCGRQVELDWPPPETKW